MASTNSLLVVTVAWNSNAWKGSAAAGDGLGFRYVKDGGFPAESWNFDFGSPRNPKGYLLAYVPRIEGCRLDAADIVITSQPDGEADRYVIGLFLDAEIEKENTEEGGAMLRGEGCYTNLRVAQHLAVSFASAPVKWNIKRHYGKDYGNRNWPGQKTFMYMDHTHARKLFSEIVDKHQKLLAVAGIDKEERLRCEKAVLLATKLMGVS